MKLIFHRAYKSITQLAPADLPEFTVLTGVNGAGKSHLLEALESGAISIEGVPANQAQGARPIRRFDSTTLVPQDSGSFSSAQVMNEQTSFWTELSQHRREHVRQFQETIMQFAIPALNELSTKKLMGLTTVDLVAMGLDEARASQVLETLKQSAASVQANMANSFIRNDPQNRKILLDRIAKATPTELFVMDQDDFYAAYPKSWQPVDLFQQSFARLFSAYNREWQQNKLKEIGKAEGEELVVLNDNEFQTKHGVPPWVFLNEILETAELDFRVNAPNRYEDFPYEPTLEDVKRHIKVKFNDLSSGERILMSFALCLYHVRDANESVEFPHLLLFDEIDAPLHPSMTRSLLRTIEQTLVNERQIKVILTTHSPSTVALAPNASIFVMQKHVVERLQKSSKDSALGILTAGVPTLSVNYENRRQVFVESKFDVKYYSALYLLAKGYLHPDISLTFIASGVGGMGNCDQVKSVVTQLREGGNCTAMGVVDWDKKNTSQAGVFAMGENERYSIDNFILDPTLLGFLLLREKFASPADFGLKPDTKYMDIGSFGQLQLQSVANYVVGKISPSSSGTEGDELVEFRYLREVAVTVPKWFAHMQGHDLEQRAKEAFPQLLRYRDEPDLKLAIIEKVLDDLPMFVPSSFATMFRKLQDHT